MPFAVTSLPLNLAAHPQQPYGITYRSTDGFMVKEMHIPRAETIVPQHSHTYSHLSMLAVGKVKAWKDDEYLGEFTAPAAIEIPAGTKHRFQSLVDDTIIYCIHNLHGYDGISVLDENNIVGGA